MTRKFRPAQCPRCPFGRYTDEVVIKQQGVSPYCMGGPYAYPIDFKGESSRLCPDFEPKPTEKTERSK